MNLYIKVKSYHPAYLNKFCLNLIKTLTVLFAIDAHVVQLPKKREQFTVLRSPHVDKKARDQFERITYKRLIVLKTPLNINLINWFAQFYKNNVGVQLELKIKKNV